MTAICGGGTSGPKAGVAETIIFTTGALASLLNNKGGLWATVAAPLLGVLTYSATNLCSDDPPDAPDITAAEYQALLDLAPWSTLTTALGKLRDLATIAIWHEMCACSSVATPPAPSDLWTPPTGVTLPTYDGSCPQPRVRLAPGYKPSPGQFQPGTNVTAQVFPQLPMLQSVSNANAAVQNIAAWPPGWQSITGHLDWVSGITTGIFANAFSLLLYLPDKTYSGSGLLAMGVSQDQTHDDDPNTGANLIDRVTYPYFACQLSQGTSTSVHSLVDLALDITCTGAAAPATCCPPDPAVLALLQQLVTAVTLEQRWRLPFATVPGSTHVVTGVGSFAVSRIAGLSLAVTSEPAGIRTSFGNPTYQFDLGWLSVSDGDGMLQELRVTRAEQSWYPQQMQLATLVGYALRDGVELTITELAPES